MAVDRASQSVSPLVPPYGTGIDVGEVRLMPIARIEGGVVLTVAESLYNCSASCSIARGVDAGSPGRRVRSIGGSAGDDDAMTWARRGIAETSGWQVAKLYDIAAGLLIAEGDHDAVLALRREQHQRMPSTSTYRLLQSAAASLARWDAERPSARAALAVRDPAGFVDALLADGDTEEAWTAASAGSWEPSASQWNRLAGAREGTDPAGALRLYLRLTELALADANKSAYRDAVSLLKAAKRAATAADLMAVFDEKLAQLREQHRRRPTFVAMVDKAALR